MRLVLLTPRKKMTETFLEGFEIINLMSQLRRRKK
jgi:hypothetical protein